MKLDYQDHSLLSALHHLDIAEYLSSRGWKVLETNPRKFSFWEYTNKEGKNFDILLPLNQKFKDYNIRILEILNTLESVENRQQTEILKDLQTIFADIVRIRRDTPETKEGTVPIEMGLILVHEAKEMILAAACSTAKPQPFFPSKKSNEIVRYMDSVVMGQTELGSYILPIISKLPFPYQGQQNISEPLDEPFERKVTKNLACALEVINSTAQECYEENTISNSIEIFKSTVEKGVSANLCEAVTEMSFYQNHYHNIEIDFTWSPKIIIEDDVPKKVVLKTEIMEIIEKAAECLREFEPKRNFNILGPVLKLERPEDAMEGKITVQSFVSESVRNIKIQLHEDFYHLAIKAHDQQKNIFCTGTLNKEGRSYWLSNVSTFKIEN